MSRACAASQQKGQTSVCCMKAPKTMPLNKVVVCSKQGFAVMRRVRDYESSLRDEWFKIDLNTGDTETLPYPKHANGHVILHADGTTLLGSGGRG